MARILTSLRGRSLGLDDRRRLVAPAGFVSGDHGSQIAHPAPSAVTLFDDFLGDVVADPWNYVEGSDTTTADGAIVAAKGGLFRLTGGDSAGSVAADGALLNSELNWYAENGGLTLQARVKLGSIASVSAFVGFTDTKALEAPIQSAASGDTVTTNATDAVGFLFDTSMATDNWWLAGVANDVDATPQNSGGAPVAGTYETFRIELTTAGVATFFRNGRSIGARMTGAVRPAIALTPVFIVWPRSAAAGKTLDIDYVHVSMAR